MYVRMLWGRLKQGRWSEYERYYNERMGDLTEGLEGFQGRQLLQSTESAEEGMSVTYWNTGEGLRTYDRSPKRQEVAKAIEHLYTGEYWARNFEIKISTL